MKVSQRAALRLLLLPRLGLNPDRNLVAAFVGHDLALSAPILPSALDMADWIIDRAMEQQTPAMLVRVIRRTDVGIDGGADSLLELADQLEARPETWQALSTAEIIEWSVEADPLQVNDGRPFVDRSAFRNLIPRLDNSDTPSCTVVIGSDGHGKSYLHDFCQGLANHWSRRQPGILRIGYSEATPSTAPSLTPGIVARELAVGLGTPFARRPRPHEDAHRYARNLAAWLVHFTPRGALPAVALLDGFDVAGIQAPVHTLIESLVRGIQDEAARLRVVLLGYDRGRLEKEQLPFEVCVLEHVGDDEIEGWFRRRYPGRDDFKYLYTVEEINAELEHSPPHLRMRTLCGLMQVMGPAFVSETGP